MSPPLPLTYCNCIGNWGSTSLRLNTNFTRTLPDTMTFSGAQLKNGLGRLKTNYKGPRVVVTPLCLSALYNGKAGEHKREEKEAMPRKRLVA